MYDISSLCRRRRNNDEGLPRTRRQQLMRGEKRTIVACGMNGGEGQANQVTSLIPLLVELTVCESAKEADRKLAFYAVDKESPTVRAVPIS
jgi:hypothetical protein